jgi:hypothetical protein
VPDVVPLEIAFVGQDAVRIHHVQTGPDWESPNVVVGDTAFRLGNPRWSGVGVLAGDDTDAPVAFVAGSAMTIEIDLRISRPGLLDIAVFAESQFADPGALTDLGGVDLGRVIAGEQPLQIETQPLPSVVDVVHVHIVYRFDSGEGLPVRVETVHPVALAWAAPIAGTPVYEQTMLWASEWAAGVPARALLEVDEIAAVENRIAHAMLDGIWSLGDEGYRYGAFPRPKDKDNQAHVFLDFKTSACGEFRGVLLALIEYHGVDAQWVMMAFRKPGKDKLSMYETRDLPAVGTGSKVWRHWNHVAVEVNGQIYDPSYGLHAKDWNRYEDDLFARYCLGEEIKCQGRERWCKRSRPEGTCFDNPPGFDPDDPRMGMEVWRGDTY